VDLAILLIIKWQWPAVIPFGTFQFWQLHGSVIQAIVRVWPMFAVGLAFNLIFAARARLVEFDRVQELAQDASLGEAGLMVAVLVTIVPLLEEVVFRWLSFYVAIVTLTGFNHLVFGFAGAGLPSWFFEHAARPVANFFTLGYAHAILYNKTSWAIGAAVLVANGKFRSGHIYQGTLGWIWSWYGGIFLFVVMFQYGLWMAIMIHALYNLMAGVVFMALFGAARRTVPALPWE
jgi:hypothetical protein